LTEYRRIIDWIDNRIGLSAPVLKPVPEYSLNPFYWLGALMVVAFFVQGTSGVLMLLHYMPNVDQAYSSTLFIMENVPLGWLMETLHLYSAYAMVLLAFMHLMRQYFVSAQKRPRELMWVVGMLMGFVVLAFGLTGYLLPWTVVSKSATDIAVGMLGFLPGQLGVIAKLLVAGPGSDAIELLRFFALHIVVLPAALLILLGIKMYMFEVHGAVEPTGGIRNGTQSIPWFPDAFLYLATLCSVFLAFLLAASVLFPLSLPPQFSPQAAASFTPQPDWYFLWFYQILKFASFEGTGIIYALVAIPIVFIVMTLLPFFDKGKERRLGQRPMYVTIGVIVVAELVVLTVWGYMTPGQVIPDSQAILATGGTALVIAILSFAVYRSRKQVKPASDISGSKSAAVSERFPILTIAFALLLAMASVTIASSVNLVISPSADSPLLVSSLVLSAFSLYFMVRILRRLVTVGSLRVKSP
jgi:quinol-cytochrome oxidoreductase complex cytochrome b subunit